MKIQEEFLALKHTALCRGGGLMLISCFRNTAQTLH